MQYEVEIKLIVIPLRTSFEHVLKPTFKWWLTVDVLMVPRCGIFRQTLQNKERAHISRGQEVSEVAVTGLSIEYVWLAKQVE
jgi:hypothetical protein